MPIHHTTDKLQKALHESAQSATEGTTISQIQQTNTHKDSHAQAHMHSGPTLLELHWIF